jgi:hypothetical protein
MLMVAISGTKEEGWRKGEKSLTERAGTLQRAVSGDEPLAAIVLGMLAILGVVVMGGRDAAVTQLLGELAVPVDVGEAFATAIRFGNSLNLDAKVVVSYHDDDDGDDKGGLCWETKRKPEWSLYVFSGDAERRRREAMAATGFLFLSKWHVRNTVFSGRVWRAAMAPSKKVSSQSAKRFDLSTTMITASLVACANVVQVIVSGDKSICPSH